VNGRGPVGSWSDAVMAKEFAWLVLIAVLIGCRSAGMDGSVAKRPTRITLSEQYINRCGCTLLAGIDA